MKNIMSDAVDQAQYSEDPNTQVGCVLSHKGIVFAKGFNHMPGRARVKFPWGKSENIVESKYPYVIHAEMAAITSCFRDIRDFDAYVTLFPCSNCAKLLIEKGVNTIYYLSDKYKDLPDTIASKKLLDGCGVKYIKVNGVGDVEDNSESR